MTALLCLQWVHVDQGNPVRMQNETGPSRAMS